MTIFFPLRYLALENAYGSYLWRRDILPMAILSFILIGPFYFIDGANYFHENGFLDKFGDFSGILTGFYVAALIAVATLSSHFADLDKKIAQGEIRYPAVEGCKGELLTRREYVCSMFGYLAFLSLLLSLFSILAVTIVPALPRVPQDWHARIGLIAFFGICISSLAVTTVRGLYYFVERLYAHRPGIKGEAAKPQDMEGESGGQAAAAGSPTDGAVEE
jgi:hypothetical protein